MIAILSDIHSNLYALEAVLQDMPEVSAVYILGDMVGGANPFPCEVLDRLMDLNIPVSAILGNWEWWMLDIKRGIPMESKNICGMWTMNALKERHWRFLENLSPNKCIGDMLIFHGSPDKLTGGALEQEEAEALAKGQDAKWLIGGHTHKAKLFQVGAQYVVNAGSVGLSSNNIGGTACYLLLDGDKISFRHITYDLEAAVKAIKDSEIYTVDNDSAIKTITAMRSGNYNQWK